MLIKFFFCVKLVKLKSFDYVLFHAINVCVMELEITGNLAKISEFLLEDGKIVLDEIPYDKIPSNINLRTVKWPFSH